MDPCLCRVRVDVESSKWRSKKPAPSPLHRALHLCPLLRQLLVILPRIRLPACLPSRSFLWLLPANELFSSSSVGPPIDDDTSLSSHVDDNSSVASFSVFFLYCALFSVFFFVFCGFVFHVVLFVFCRNSLRKRRWSSKNSLIDYLSKRDVPKWFWMICDSEGLDWSDTTQNWSCSTQRFNEYIQRFNEWNREKQSITKSHNIIIFAPSAPRISIRCHREKSKSRKTVCSFSWFGLASDPPSRSTLQRNCCKLQITEHSFRLTAGIRGSWIQVGAFYFFNILLNLIDTRLKDTD
jgi:hypothetical protein